MEITEMQMSRFSFLRYEFLSMQKKDKKIVPVIQHSLIPQYNPVTKTYKEFDENSILEWFVHIGLNKTYVIYAKYSKIEKILKYILTGS